MNRVEPQPQTSADGPLSEEDADPTSSVSTEFSQDDCLRSVICCPLSSDEKTDQVEPQPQTSADGSPSEVRPKEEQKQDGHGVVKKIWPNEELRIKEKRPQRQISLALKIIGALHREERKNCWSRFTAVAVVLIFFVGLLSTTVGWICNGIVKPWVEFPCFTLTVLDAILLFCYGKLELHKKLFTPKGLQRFQRWQYYFDSLVDELLLYPVTICSVISISTQSAWTTNYSDPSTVTCDDGLGILDLILGPIDVITLIYIYGHRVRQIFWLMKDLHKNFNIKGKLPITYRIVFFIASNALLFIFMTTHLFIQIYHDNLPEGDQPCKVQADNKHMAYHLIGDNVINSNYFSHNGSTNLTMLDDNKICIPFLTGMMLLVTILLPVVNLFTFLSLNYPSFLKLLIDLNYFVTFGKDYDKNNDNGKDNERNKNKDNDKYENIDSEIWELVDKMKEETRQQCNAVNSLNKLQRLSLVTREWWIDVIVMLWAGLLAGYCMLFYRYYIRYVEITDWSEATNSQKAYAILYIVLFTLSIAIVILANFKGLLAAVIAPIMIIPALRGDLRKTMTEREPEHELKNKPKRKRPQAERKESRRESRSSNSDSEEKQCIPHSHTSLSNQVSGNQSAPFDIKPDLHKTTLDLGRQTEENILNDGNTQAEVLEYSLQQSQTDNTTSPPKTLESIGVKTQLFQTNDTTPPASVSELIAAPPQQSGTDDAAPPSSVSGRVDQSGASLQQASFLPSHALPTLTWKSEKSWTASDGKTVDATGKDHKVIIVIGSCTTCGTESEPLRLGIKALSTPKRRKTSKPTSSSRDRKSSKKQEEREVPKTLTVGWTPYLKNR